MVRMACPRSLVLDKPTIQQGLTLSFVLFYSTMPLRMGLSEHHASGNAWGVVPTCASHAPSEARMI